MTLVNNGLTESNNAGREAQKVWHKALEVAWAQWYKNKDLNDENRDKAIKIAKRQYNETLERLEKFD